MALTELEISSDIRCGLPSIFPWFKTDARIGNPMTALGFVGELPLSMAVIVNEIEEISTTFKQLKSQQSTNILQMKNAQEQLYFDVYQQENTA